MLVVLPGFASDVLALLLLLPPIRSLVRAGCSVPPPGCPCSTARAPSSKERPVVHQYHHDGHAGR